MRMRNKPENWRTGNTGHICSTIVVTVDAKRTVENTGYMENWRTGNTGHICSTVVVTVDAKRTVENTG